MELETLINRVLRTNHAKAAKHYGLSESALRSILKERGCVDIHLKPEYGKEELEQLLKHYKSVRFLSRMTSVPEGHIREQAKKLDVDARLLIDYSVGNNSNAKGRRAEQDFANLRGALIKRDLNIDEGSQAPYDFDDELLAKVNVKSSRRFKYKAMTRAADPFFWKVSTNAQEKCDLLVVMCYCDKGEVLEGVTLVRPGAATKTITLTKSQLHAPSALINLSPEHAITV